MTAVVYGFAAIGAVLTFLILVGLLLSLVDVRRSRRRHVADGLIAHPAGKGFDQHADEAVAVVGDDWRHETRRATELQCGPDCWCPNDPHAEPRFDWIG